MTIQFGTPKGYITEEQIVRIIENLKVLLSFLESKEKKTDRIYIRIEMIKGDISNLKEIL